MAIKVYGSWLDRNMSVGRRPTERGTRLRFPGIKTEISLGCVASEAPPTAVVPPVLRQASGILEQTNLSSEVFHSVWGPIAGRACPTFRQFLA